jgi:hypothetical protein
MGSTLRRRRGVYWFRRRVPDPLKSRVSRCEINRSLRTSCSKGARRRAREAWLRTEAVFEQMAGKSLGAEQAAVFVRRLLGEPLFQSETAGEVLAAVEAKDFAPADLIFRHVGEILPDLPPTEAARFLDCVSACNFDPLSRGIGFQN